MTWWKNWFNRTEEVKEPDPFIEKLKEKGCHYNEEENCWEAEYTKDMTLGEQVKI